MPKREKRTTEDLDELHLHARMGRAALIPGMQRAIEIMQRELDKMRLDLMGLEAPEKQPESKRKNFGTILEKIRKQPSGWSSDPEERKREMARRMAAHQKKAKGLHPRDADHPDHAKWLRKMRRVSKRTWEKLSPAERNERQNKMRAARGLPTVRLAVA